MNDPQVYLHFVWATKNREALIPPELERSVYRVIEADAQKSGCQVMAINGMADHIHLLVRFGRTTTMGTLMNQVKGVSSSFLNARLYPGEELRFRWQPNYGVYSVSPNHVSAVLAYVLNQKQHHAEQTTYAAWEMAGEMDLSGASLDSDVG